MESPKWLPRKVKSSLGCAFLMCLFGPWATQSSADPMCVAGTIATVMAQGACTIGDKTFDFTKYYPSNTGNVSSANAATNVLFTPLTGNPLDPGFELAAFNSTAGDYTVESGTLDYTVSVTNGSANLIGDDVTVNNPTLTTAPIAAPGSGLAATAFDAFNYLYNAGAEADQSVQQYQYTGEAASASSYSSGPVTFALISSGSGYVYFETYAYDYNYDTDTYGTGGTATAAMSSVDYTFQEQSPVAVTPEPGTLLLFGSGLISIHEIRWPRRALKLGRSGEIHRRGRLLQAAWSARLVLPFVFPVHQNTYDAGRFSNMSIFLLRTGFSRSSLASQVLVSTLSLALVFATLPQGLSASQDNQTPPPTDQAAPPPPSYAQQTPEELQRLVAPIALYPDSLVAQILAASTFPEEVVEADRWVEAHPDLKGDALGKAVDQQPWDPSVKALTAFPSVLGNMDKNLSWTSSLGDAYYNQQQDVMSAIQVMRQKAEQAGNLKTTPQQSVTTDDYGDIDIAPADPDVVYVPAYDPWLVYGYPILAWPGWYLYPGIWFGGPYLSFGIGFGIGWFGGFGWGWGNWGFDWHNHYAVFDHARYFSQSRTFYNRDNFYRGGMRSGFFNRGTAARPFEGSQRDARGFSARGESGMRSGAFSNYDHGGESRTYSSRGAASFGGFRGGGFGGGARGGGRR